ncbi:MAG: aldo/keto reductase [Treponema sp.]|nr:aldo/keto reductase [Treponema sp.]
MKRTMLTMTAALLAAFALTACHSNKNKASLAQSAKTTAGVPLITLNNGVQMPQFGLGTYAQPSDEVCYESCLTALRDGYRHIDTAHAYYDERGVGRAVKQFCEESGVPRSEIWITSKLWPSEYGEGVTAEAIDKMLARLQLDYLDLLYVHQPAGDFVGAWKDMEKAYEAGKVRSLGISNFDVDDEPFNMIMEGATIKPQVAQIECVASLAACLPSFCLHKNSQNYFCEFANGKLVKFA